MNRLFLNEWIIINFSDLLFGLDIKVFVKCFYE